MDLQNDVLYFKRRLDKQTSLGLGSTRAVQEIVLEMKKWVIDNKERLGSQPQIERCIAKLDLAYAKCEEVGSKIRPDFKTSDDMAALHEEYTNNQWYMGVIATLEAEIKWLTDSVGGNR